MGPSWTRDQTHVSCTGRQILNQWVTKEVQNYFILINNQALPIVSFKAKIIPYLPESLGHLYKEGMWACTCMHIHVYINTQSICSKLCNICHLGYTFVFRAHCPWAILRYKNSKWEIQVINTHITQLKAGAQAVNDILCQVWVVRVPYQPNCDNLWCVHQHTANPNPFSTVALKYTYQVSLTCFSLAALIPLTPGLSSPLWTPQLTGQFRRSPMVLAFCSSSPNMLGEGFSRLSSIQIAWLLWDEKLKGDDLGSCTEL